MVRKPVILCLLLCSGVFAARSQEILFFGQPRIAWSGLEQKPSPAQIDGFITRERKDFPQFWSRPEIFNSDPLDSLKARLHFLDLDGDHQPDVIFDGESGGEANEIMIYLSRGNTYKKVFSTIQGVMRMDWENGRLHKLYVQDWGCCADYVITNKIYQLDYDQAGNPKFIQTYQGYSTRFTVAPTDSVKPFRFEVLNDRYNIRFAPAIDDTSGQEWSTDSHPHSGNIIGYLAKGATGTALAKEVDATGRIWLFVEIDEEFYPPGDALPDAPDNEFPTKVAGWISSRFVKRI